MTGRRLLWGRADGLHRRGGSPVLGGCVAQFHSTERPQAVWMQAAARSLPLLPRQMFPEDVPHLVDLSGKKWAHTAVIRLPFPDVAAITEFVREQLGEGGGEGGSEGGSEDGGGEGNGGVAEGGSRPGSRSSGAAHLSEEERSRNEFGPALLLLSAECHPLAPRLIHRLGGGSGGAAAEGAGKQGPAPTGASILSLLPGGAGGDAQLPWAEQAGAVLVLPLDLAGQEVPPFSAGLLPGGAR